MTAVMVTINEKSDAGADAAARGMAPLTRTDLILLACAACYDTPLPADVLDRIGRGFKALGPHAAVRRLTVDLCAAQLRERNTAYDRNMVRRHLRVLAGGKNDDSRDAVGMPKLRWKRDQGQGQNEEALP